MGADIEGWRRKISTSNYKCGSFGFDFHLEIFLKYFYIIRSGTKSRAVNCNTQRAVALNLETECLNIGLLLFTLLC